MSFVRFTLVTVWVLLAQPVMAGTITNLYQADISVAKITEKPTSEQVRSGLQQVLVRVSGNSSIASNPAIQGQLKSSGIYLQQFSFLPEGPVLQLSFNQNQVDALIAQTGVKPLGVQRPTVLFWLVSDQNQVQDYMAAEASAVKALLAAARVRGIPAQFPIFDLTDQAALPVADIWGLFAEPIAAASERYRPDAVVAARLNYQDSGQVRLEWSFSSGQSSKRLSGLGTENQVLQEMIDTVADSLFKPVVSHKLSDFQEGVKVHFSNVSSLSDFIQLSEFLKGLSAVRMASPERVSEDDVIMRIVLDGTEAQLQQTIAVEPRLHLIDRIVDPAGRAVLHYRWQN